MRGSVGKEFSFADLPDLTPGEAAFSQAVHESPYIKLKAIADIMDLPKGRMVDPPELNTLFPDMDEKFTAPMDINEASFLADRAKVRRSFNKILAAQPKDIGTQTELFVDGLVGGMVDPVGNALGLVPVAKIMGLAGTTTLTRAGILASEKASATFAARGVEGLLPTLGQSLKNSIIDNVAGNAAAEGVSYLGSKGLYEEYDESQFGTALLGGAAFGGLTGALSHYFRPNPYLGETIMKHMDNRLRTGHEPNGAFTIFDAFMAAEHDSTHFPYEYRPFDNGRKFYSSSINGAEQMHLAEHGVFADVGTSRGIQLVDNPNAAHAKALTPESGSVGHVMSHYIMDKKIVDGDAPLSAHTHGVELREAINAALKDAPEYIRYGDISVKTAHNIMVKAHNNGVISDLTLQAFENAIGDGMFSKLDNFRGHGHTPTNMVYVFDKEKVIPKSVERANPEARAKLSLEKVDKLRRDENVNKFLAFTTEGMESDKALSKKIKKKTNPEQIELGAATTLPADKGLEIVDVPRPKKARARKKLEAQLAKEGKQPKWAAGEKPAEPMPWEPKVMDVDHEPQITIESERMSRLDSTYDSLRSDLDAKESIGEHLQAEDITAIKDASDKFDLANKMADIYNIIKSC